MTPHTPGPWHIGKHGSVVTDTPDDQVRITGIDARDTIEWYGGHVICETVTDANAALIAAAPELLEALKEALSVISLDFAEWKQEHLPRHDWDAKPEHIPNNEYAVVIIEIRAAIAKAEATK